MPETNTLIFMRGGGDLGTGVAHRLHQAGFAVVVCELPQPLVVRRAVAFAEAVYTGTHTVEGVTAHLVADVAAAHTVLAQRAIPVFVDPTRAVLQALRPPVVVDARLAKQPLDTSLSDAPLVVALGPGFTVGEHCHAVVETNRGHNLGRVYWQGSAEPNTGKPEAVQGHSADRVLRTPCAGVLQARKAIGDLVVAGEVVAVVNNQPLPAPFAGVLRGLIHDGTLVTAGLKVGDLDPRGIRANCFTISDKARAIGGGVLEAVLAGRRA